MSSMAPDVEVRELSGGVWRLWDALEAGPVALLFIKSSCPTCRFTLPFVQRLIEKAGPGAPTVLAISQDDAGTTAKFLEHFGIRVPAAVDPAWDFVASTAFGVRNVPALFLVEPDKRVTLAVEGFSKRDLEALGERFGVSPFEPGEQVPEFRPG